MPTTYPVKPEILRWAIERSGLSDDDLSAFPVDQWESGAKAPTIKKLEAFAKKTMVPLGYLFLTKPPEEKILLPDFRTAGDTPIKRPSPNLIDTIHTMQRRQVWMREYLLELGQDALPYVGSVKVGAPVENCVKLIRKELDLRADWARSETSWQNALRTLRQAIEEAGILVSINGIVGNNTHRKLDPQEFRGFVIADDIAPFIFVNGADSQSAQMFTLVHELVHIWVGQDGIFNLIHMKPTSERVERYCNRVAGEFLVPKSRLSQVWPKYEDDEDRFEKIALGFKVSPLVVARRSLDLKLITQNAFFVFYNSYLKKISEIESRKKPGGNFYRTVNVRIGERFGYAVVQAASEGKLPFRDAYSLLGISGKTYDEYARLLKKQLRK